MHAGPKAIWLLGGMTRVRMKDSARRLSLEGRALAGNLGIKLRWTGKCRPRLDQRGQGHHQLPPISIARDVPSAAPRMLRIRVAGDASAGFGSSAEFLSIRGLRQKRHYHTPPANLFSYWSTWRLIAREAGGLDDNCSRTPPAS